MTWGNFTTCNAVHSAPCTQVGTILPGHELSPTCECKPTPERQTGWRKTLWQHHDNH